MTCFDDARLDDEAALARGRRLAALPRRGGRAGPPRGRRGPEAGVDGGRRRSAASRPRAVVAAGPDSRLLRAVLEPWCPVPFVAWPGPGLPGWAGALDLVVVLAPRGRRRRHRVRPSPRRSAAAASWSSPARRGRSSPSTPPAATARCCRRRPATRSPRRWSCCELLDLLDLGPGLDAERGRRRARRRRGRLLAAPRHRGQPGQEPRASRSPTPQPLRVGRHRCSPPAPLAGSPSPSGAPPAARRSPPTPTTCCRCIEPAPAPDLFADPFADAETPGRRRPGLLILDDGTGGADGPRVTAPARCAAAERHGVRVRDRHQPRPTATWPATRPCSPPASYAATYLGVGLG